MESVSLKEARRRLGELVKVDTSVLVACYCPEPRSDAAEDVLRDPAGAAISRLVELEFCSAVALKRRMGETEGHEHRPYRTATR